VHPFGTEIDDAEVVALVAVLLLVAEVGLVPSTDVSRSSTRSIT
jgi:hypothetical protein